MKMHKILYRHLNLSGIQHTDQFRFIFRQIPIAAYDLNGPPGQNYENAQNFIQSFGQCADTWNVMRMRERK